MNNFFNLQCFAVIKGTAGNDYLRGTSTSDSLIAYGGDDTLYGGMGNDIFVYSGGNDVIKDYKNNSSEQDAIQFVGVKLTDCYMDYGGSFRYDLIITTSKGTLTIEDYWHEKISVIDTDETDTDSAKNISNILPGRFIIGSNYNDTISNKNYYVTIKSGAGNDSIYNSMEKVYLPGASGNDYIDSGKGNDIISNRSSRVTIKAAEGNDKIYSSGENVTISGGAGNDYISNYGSCFVTISGDSGNDYIHSEGGTFVTIFGGAGNDTIFFDDSGSSWHGSYITDKRASIDGGKGNDYIYSEGDSVTITGGKGKDNISLASYARRNVIKYASGEGNDTISGFNSDDILHITKGSYSATVSGNDVIVTVDTGKITLKDAKGKQISIKNSKGTTKTYGASYSALFAENNFVTADNLNEIVKNDLTATDYKIETQNFENLTQENNLITFADK